MNKQDYDKVSEKLLQMARDVADLKRPDYTIGSEDVLANFKNVAVRWGMTPFQAWGVYAQKHMDAITSIMRDPGREASEPPLGRFADLINYTLLGWALLEEWRLRNEGWRVPGEGKEAGGITYSIEAAARTLLSTDPAWDALLPSLKKPSKG